MSAVPVDVSVYVTVPSVKSASTSDAPVVSVMLVAEVVVTANESTVDDCVRFPAASFSVIVFVAVTVLTAAHSTAVFPRPIEAGAPVVVNENGAVRVFPLVSPSH